MISHTAPVTVLAEVGAIGFALFVVLFGALGVVLWRVLPQGEPEGWAQWTVLAMITGIFVHSLLYSALLEDPYLWALAAVGVAIGSRRAVEAPDTTPRAAGRRPSRRGIAGAVTPTAPLRIMCLSNMYPGPEDPDYGAFVESMCDALERAGHEVERVVIASRAHGAAPHAGQVRGARPAARSPEPARST